MSRMLGRHSIEIAIMMVARQTLRRREEENSFASAS